MADHPKRILIVEDNETDVKLLKDIIESRGYETLQTGDGLEAIDLAVAKRPDLILIDHALSPIIGFDEKGNGPLLGHSNAQRAAFPGGYSEWTTLSKSLTQSS
jgi:ActR/RegA family two-component response regulator